MDKLNKGLFCLHCFLCISLNHLEFTGIFMSHRYWDWDQYANSWPYPIAVLSAVLFSIRFQINYVISTVSSMETCIIMLSADCNVGIWCLVTNGIPWYLRDYNATCIMMLRAERKYSFMAQTQCCHLYQYVWGP